jgi:hypothetical protein
MLKIKFDEKSKISQPIEFLAYMFYIKRSFLEALCVKSIAEGEFTVIIFVANSNLCFIKFSNC